MSDNLQKRNRKTGFALSLVAIWPVTLLICGSLVAFVLVLLAVEAPLNEQQAIDRSVEKIKSDYRQNCDFDVKVKVADTHKMEGNSYDILHRVESDDYGPYSIRAFVYPDVYFLFFRTRNVDLLGGIHDCNKNQK